jgi:hypothetical protein
VGGLEEDPVGRQEMRFRKKPVEVEAVRFVSTAEGIDLLRSFCGDSLGRVLQWPDMLAEAEICTLEDGTNMKVKHIATEGDWIIKGVKGEFYPCKHDIFEVTYEAVV